MSSCTMRSQVLCLTAYLDPGTARRAAYLFAALSRACHYHPYELAPTAAELTGWLLWLDLTAKVPARESLLVDWPSVGFHDQLA